MSFSGMVKEELSRQIGSRQDTAGLQNQQHFSFCACHMPQKDKILRFQTENEAVVRKYFTLLQKTFNIEYSSMHSREQSATEKEMYICVDY